MVFGSDTKRKPVRLRRRQDGGPQRSSAESISGETLTDEDEYESVQSSVPAIVPSGCRHYTRRCKLVCPICDISFPCRFCHDEIFNPTTLSKRPVLWGDTVVPLHKIDRKAVTEIVCTDCDYRQAVASHCVKCGVLFGAYHCMKCNLFDDDVSKKIWHCDKCGLCRVGGKENYYHCENCDGCYPLSLRGKHKCLRQAMHGDCPICLEPMFDSTKSVAVLRNCGHTLHQACFVRHSHSNYEARDKCPLCLVEHSPASLASEEWDTEEIFEDAVTDI